MLYIMIWYNKNMKSKTTQEFIEQAKKIHKNLYNYSKVRYINNQTKVVIVCKIHGQFLQAPSHHLSKKGCALCKGSRRKTTEEFITESKKIHKDTYNYSKVKYINNQTKVTITCIKHGDFFQIPSSHIYKKAGCPICAIEHRKNKLTKAVETFIEQAHLIHKDTYDYSKIEYISSLKKVEIICKKHGSFWQTPSNHLNGKNCKKCSIEKRTDIRRKGIKKFIEEVKKTHQDTYDYANIEYINNKIKIAITCKVHGIFWQNPSHHLSGSGCPNCSFTGFNTNKPAILYYLKVNTDKYPLYKIGVTNYTVQKRFSKNDLKKIVILKIFTYRLGEDALKEEKRILKQFKTYQHKGDKILESKGDSELFVKDILSLDTN